MKTRKPDPDLTAPDSVMTENAGLDTDPILDAPATAPPTPELESSPAPETCPHIATAAAWVDVHTKEGHTLEDAIARCADWASRNAPNLYTLSQALHILRGLFKV
jgi:hypothetical protein